MLIRAALWIITFCVPVGAQIATPDKCDHETDSHRRFEKMRILQPVKVRAFNGKTIEWTSEDREGIFTGSFDIAASTSVPTDFAKTFKRGWFWIIYCSFDSHVYAVMHVDLKQIKKK